MKKLNLIFPALIGIIVLISSCKKAEVKKENSQSAQDAVSLSAEVFDIVSLSEDALSDFDSRLRVNQEAENTCKSVVHSPSNQVITIDFGNNSCIGSDGRSRLGKIKISYNGKYRSPGSKTSISLENYYANGKRLKGAIEISTVDASNYSISVKDFYYWISPKDSTIWNASLSKVWKSGMDTYSVFDDKYEIDGTLSGVDQLFQKYEAKITSPLLVNYECFKTGITFPTKGTMDVKTVGFLNRNVNYGLEDCDKTVILTINGISTIQPL